MKNPTSLIAATLLMVCSCSTLLAGTFAKSVIQYVPGTSVSATNPNAALGKPGPGVAGFPGFNNAETLNPFFPHFSGDQLVQIGPGGSLTLRLDQYVQVGTGLELGIFGNVGLEKTLTDTAANPATAFGVDEIKIEVSETGLPGEWAALNGGNRVAINDPTSFFTDDNGFVGTTADVADLLPLLTGFTEADFGQPLDNPNGLTTYNDLNLAAISTLYDGSAGGDWFDLDGLTVGGQPLTQVGYVRFSDPGVTQTIFGPDDRFELVAVSINASLAGATVPIPEPSACALLLSACGLFSFRRKR